jgi:hypothetical protein
VDGVPLEADEALVVGHPEAALLLLRGPGGEELHRGIANDPAPGAHVLQHQVKVTLVRILKDMKP